MVRIMIAAGLLIALAGAASALEEGIVRNADGDYIITFRSETSGQMIQWRWVPSTKIDPTMVSNVVQGEAPGTFVYSYIVTNGATSKQDLSNVRLIASSIISIKQPSFCKSPIS